MWVIETGGAEVAALGFAPVSSVLVAGVQRRGLLGFGPAGGEPARLLFDEAFWRFDFAPDGGALVLATGHGLRWLDLEVRLPIAYPLASDLPPPLCCGFSADFTRLVTAHGMPWYGHHAGWRAVDGRWEQEWVGPRGPMETPSLRVCPTGARCAYVARTQNPPAYVVKTRSAAAGREEAVGGFPSPRPPSSGLLFRPDGRQLLTTHGPYLAVWPVPELGTPRVVRNTSARHFTAAAYHPDGRHLFTAGNDAAVTVWDTAAWEPLRRYAWGIGKLKAVAVSADGALAAAGSDTGQVVVWDVD